MKKPNYQQSFYTTPIFIIPAFLGLFAFLGLLLLLGIFSSVANAFSSKGEIIQANSNFCQLATLSELAVKHGVRYQIDNGFDIPAIKLLGDKTLIQKVYQDYDKIYPKDTISTAQESPQQCHLNNARYNAENVNPRLAPLIPNDVDYVSYAPNADKAMYCYYHLSDYEQLHGKNNGSQCYFLQIKNEYGTEWLIKDDISDLENANLTWAKENYQSAKNQTSLNNVYTYVYSWDDKPNLRYGFTLGTNYNGTRWLAGGTY